MLTSLLQIRFLMAVFVSLSTLDLLLTWRLVEGSEGAVYEANPLAALVLLKQGWAGLALYKFACVGVAAGIGVVVCRFRPRLGRSLVLAASAVLTAVVGYSTALLALGDWDAEERPRLTEELLREQALQRNIQEMDRYWQRAREISRELAAGNCSLLEATQELESVDQITYSPIHLLRVRCEGYSDEACLAVLLFRQVGHLERSQPKLYGRRLRQVKNEFERDFQQGLPEFACTQFDDLLSPVGDVTALESPNRAPGDRGGRGCVPGRQKRDGEAAGRPMVSTSSPRFRLNSYGRLEAGVGGQLFARR